MTTNTSLAFLTRLTAAALLMWSGFSGAEDPGYRYGLWETTETGISQEFLEYDPKLPEQSPTVSHHCVRPQDPYFLASLVKPISSCLVAIENTGTNGFRWKSECDLGGHVRTDVGEVEYGATEASGHVVSAFTDGPFGAMKGTRIFTSRWLGPCQADR